MSDLSKQYHSLIIDDKNTWDDWHLIPSSRPFVSPPTVLENYIEIPGRDGFIDMSELLGGRPHYGPRSGSWEFIVDPDYALSEPWDTKFSKIMRYLHGKTHHVTLEDDRYCYYEGRLKVNSWRSDANWSSITIGYVLQPYKREMYMVGTEDWVWNPFDFETGVVEDYYGLPVSGSSTVEVIGGDEPVVPTIVVNNMGSSFSVSFGGTSYPLVNGNNTIPQIRLTEGSNELIFSGVGTVSVQFRRGWL